MKNEGITLIALIITIIVLLILAGVSLNMIMGDNGLVTKATTVELEYTKSEVEETLEMIINQKLVAAYESVQESGEDISKYYNENDILDDLKTNGYISEVGGATINNVQNDGNKVCAQYTINVSALSSEIDKYGSGSESDVFTLEVVVDETTGNSSGTYKLCYYDEDSSINDTNTREELVDIVLYATNDS